MTSEAKAMTDLASRIADARGRAVRSLNIKLQLVPNNFEPQEAHPSLAKDQLIIDMADEIDRLKAQLEKAREALEPFAKDAQRNLSSVDDGKGLTIVYQQYAPLGGVGHIKVGHLRAAARVHAELAGKEKADVRTR